MVRTQVQLTEHQIRSLRQLSAATGKSIADLVRQSVERFLSARASLDRECQVERALGVVGRFSSGQSDISAEHDRYLAEAFRK